jgi:hypothetical protein
VGRNRLNALGATALQAPLEVAGCDRRPTVPVVIVRGARTFSAGADLQGLPIVAAAPESGRAPGRHGDSTSAPVVLLNAQKGERLMAFGPSAVVVDTATDSTWLALSDSEWRCRSAS